MIVKKTATKDKILQHTAFVYTGYKDICVRNCYKNSKVWMLYVAGESDKCIDVAMGALLCNVQELV